MPRALASSKGGECPRPWPFQGRIEHENSCRRGCAGASPPLDRAPGQRHDIAFAHDLIEGVEAEALIADKGYDANHLIETIEQNDTQIVIPPKSNRKARRAYDIELYKERNRIERFFNKLKQFRRVATRYDKLLANFMGFVKLAAIAIWLK
jgi:putative transposase